ncbi:inverse autotransporter beta domain-containing protein [Aestuariivirga litoralis]|uniref:inverse autotransporter beta domain-containing protein n=1 Tax=Aestuariivirga litoralis TaxID=2650924 RepID=UPI00137AC1F4|nr:inverse autotransporter beta domain-containing protein [Aestuariivirga litoralis]
MAEAAGMGPLDGRMVRQAVAGTLLGAVANRLRPSRLLGEDAASSPLGATLDGAWGLGQQAALQAIVEGRAPGGRQLQAAAVQAAAAVANQQVAALAGSATRFGQDHAIPFLRNLEVEAGWSPGRRAMLRAQTVDALFQSAALDHTLFLEAAVNSDIAETTLNAGLGYRYQRPGSDWMFGVNAFYDRAWPIGHQRMSLGLEASTSTFTLFANRYLALSGWTGSDPGFEARPLSGWDAGIAGELPWNENLRVALSAFRWERRTEQDSTGLKLMLDYDLGAGIMLGGTFAADDTGAAAAALRLTYQFGAAAFDGGAAEDSARRDRRLAFVNRDNLIHTERRAVPQDYAVAFLAGSVTAVNQQSLGFVLAGAPLGARYSYLVTSSGGGAPLTGSGRVSADPQPVTGIDVSGLADGILTLSLGVVSGEGAAGPQVTAEITKSTTALGADATSPGPNPTNQSPIAFRIRFTEAVSGLDATALAVGNGSSANLRSDDNITWTLDVTPAGQGDVTLQVPAGATTAAASGKPNEASNLASVSFDSAAPSGYSVSFLPLPASAAGFAVSGAEPGASYAFTITSSGGGTPVSGSGTITSASQQVTGLDLTGLGDGTLTLTVTLSDALGNPGSPATATMAKTNDAPVILSVTAPAPGDYDDL